MITKLEWDSKFYGRNIASVNFMDEDDVVKLDHYIKSDEIDFIQALCKIDDMINIRILENKKFHFADVKITYSLKIRELAQLEGAIFNIAIPQDSTAICKIASDSFINSRYYGHELIFGKDKVNEMFRDWARKSIYGEFDDFCLKLVAGNEIRGFITVKIRESKTATIGILAVDENSRGKGVGEALLHSLFSFLRNKNIFEVEVATQGKNIIAQNLYSKAGFRVKKLESWYYYYS
ncbi:GNAT family N-acetyltransferase [Paenibacillus silagei]|uniref:dTDP-4-amino-4,6-dideoxy-D-galactose acyltransferase n=1 Tax=Paenibacillus silagei TaxID=1670801 RepID=A0ABS4NK47_9BACL|nr:GNAT family N-acetyltransferase [Paenibacillus silagei]MBP2109881.1 dTDP-4-amino-4,6-dideoxy-D-galactose acyltransferase [Paenibacillus silagei]